MPCAIYRMPLRSRFVAGLTASGLVGAAFWPVPTMAQGLFDMLFGGGWQRQQQVVAYAPDPPAGQRYGYGYGQEYDRSWGGREHRLRKQAKPKLPKAVTQAVDDTFGEKPVKTPPPPVGKGPLGPFLNDPTLRAGDVVVTSQGLMVYRGPGGSSHTPREFASLAKAGTKNAQLAAIERANKRVQSPTTVAISVVNGQPAQTASAASNKR